MGRTRRRTGVKTLLFPRLRSLETTPRTPFKTLAIMWQISLSGKMKRSRKKKGKNGTMRGQRKFRRQRGKQSTAREQNRRIYTVLHSAKIGAKLFLSKVKE